MHYYNFFCQKIILIVLECNSIYPDNFHAFSLKTVGNILSVKRNNARYRKGIVLSFSVMLFLAMRKTGTKG